MTQSSARSRRGRGQNGDPGSDALGGPAFFAVDKYCDANHGKIHEVVEDPRVGTYSTVFASVTELGVDTDEPNHGLARWTVQDVSPRDGAVDVAILNTWPDDLPFRLSLWVINGYL
jgi:hypothetical protein